MTPGRVAYIPVAPSNPARTTEIHTVCGIYTPNTLLSRESLYMYVCIGWSSPNKSSATLLIMYVPRTYTKRGVQYNTGRKQTKQYQPLVCFVRFILFERPVLHALLPAAADFSSNFIIYFFLSIGVVLCAETLM